MEQGFFIRDPAPGALNVALVAGPMYDPLYDLLPEFERRSGRRVHVAARLVHPELNAHVAEAYASGRARYDLISTHNKYAPSQAAFLLPLGDMLRTDELERFIPEVLEMSRVDGKLLSLPRNIDVRLIYYRADLFGDPAEREGFRRATGRELRVPETWDELAEVARHFARPPGLYGFAFPGRDSGLFGTFFELLAMAGGALFQPDLSPGFVNPAGRWALGLLRRLYLDHRVTPRELPEMRYDEVTDLFLAGRCALIADWPGGFHRYQNPAESQVVGRFGLALYPTGPAGVRRVYAGGHTFAIPTSVRDKAGALELLRFLTSAEAQWHEAQHGALPVLKETQQRMKSETPPDAIEGRRLRLLEHTVQNDLLLPPRFARYPAIEEAVWRSLQKGIVGEGSVEESLERAAADMARLREGLLRGE